MSAGTHTVRIGTIECSVISDGTFPGTPSPYTSPKGFLFSKAPQDELAMALREHDVGLELVSDWIIPFAGLLIKTDSHVVLMDTGAGALGPDTGKLRDNLMGIGVRPEDIDSVIHTHAHRDHVGGNTDSEGNRVFTNARYFIWKDEWDYWNADETRRSFQGTGREGALQLTLKNLAPLKGRVDLIKREGEFIPGISAIEAPGHTPGHMALLISSGGKHLLCLADTIHHVIHLEHPEWATAIDLDRERVTTTRRNLLGRAAREQLLVFATHLPFPGLGHVVAKGDAWRWLPIDA
jgi:glyoxylase-like metal-dependent hydrolase (beta-lactamase superfamily II)